MIDRFPAIVLLTILSLSMGCAVVEAGQPALANPASAPIASPPSSSAPNAQAPAPAVSPQIDTAEITRRAYQELGVNIDATIAGWQRELDRVESDLGRPRLRYTELNKLRDELQRTRSGVEDFRSHLRPHLEAVKAQADLLGPAPAATQPQEPNPIALRRAEINYHLGLLSAGGAAVNSANLRIDNLLNTIQVTRRKNFTSNLFQPVPGIYSVETWTQLPQYFPLAASGVGNLIADWWKDIHDRQEVLRTALEAAMLWLALTFVGWRGVRRLRRWRGVDDPPFWRRASSAAGVILLRTLPVVAPIIFLYAIIAEAQPLPQRVDRLFYSAAQSIIIIFTVNALVTTVFAPMAPSWRLVPASDRVARRICGLILLLAILYGSMTLIDTASRVVQAPFTLTLAVAFSSSLLLAAILVGILLTPLEGKHQDGLPSVRWLNAVRLPVWITIAVIVVSALAGYLALSQFLAQQLIVTGSILALVYLLLLWVDGFAQGLADDGAARGRWLERRAGLDQQRREQLALPVSLFLKFAVLVLSVPLIMLQWHYTWFDIYDWYKELFFGFHIANTQVSFAALLASVIVFALGYAAARLFQSWLDARVLKPAGISGGVRDSIRTSVGYAGVIIAALAAFSYAGFNFSNLAIVAGAFSIGIGFGLQSLVSNFVSGLILLAERPIKVGDVVVVGGEEGYVRRISVRSTEVETFDRAHVLIPNSYFITEKVKNWTLRNNVRRVTIPVGVAYGCDRRKVMAILLEVARVHPNVMTSPEPAVHFEEFAADSLNFRLYAFVDDIGKAAGTSTDLRMAILDAFDAAGIVIPFRQTDVTIRNMDWLHNAVNEYVSHSRNGQDAGNGKEAPGHAGVPEGTVASSRNYRSEKNRCDEIEIADLARSGTSSVPVRTESDGGTHPILQERARTGAGERFE
jgi:potassium-dependent mechanosensitive channel